MKGPFSVVRKSLLEGVWRCVLRVRAHIGGKLGVTSVTTPCLPRIFAFPSVTSSVTEASTGLQVRGCKSCKVARVTLAGGVGWLNVKRDA